ncbi:MAG TPA: OmpA family protein [Thermoanaerobaculia bacterium]|nr:OmpA family protein [Thermoanaerobaculia bacterium]
MLIKRLSILLVAAAASGTAFAGEPPPGLQIRATRPDANVTYEKSLADGKALVTVLDSKKEPVLGLTARDFTVTRADAAGKVVSAEPVSQSVDVPRHVVLVLDNSDSMVERKAVAKLLADFGAVLKTIRPIDDVRLVVFTDMKKSVKMGGRAVHVEVLKSNKPSELEAFASKAYREGSTTETTVLCEAVFAGVELIREMPVGDPRFLMVFSDGEEINSAFKGDVVIEAAKGVPNFRAYAIDYMPGPAIDPFLASFTKAYGGQAKKAGTAADLVAVLQQSATKLEHHYAVAWEFAAPPAPPPPLPSASPKTMVFAHAALFDFNKADLKPEGKEQLKAYREKARAEMSSAEKVRITGHTDNVGKAEYNMKLSLRRAEAVRNYLVSLGVDPGKMEVGGEGMAKPIADNGTAEGRAKNRRVEVTVIGLGK